MIELLKKLSSLNGTSGNEEKVRDFIISQIKDYCEYKTDNLGNILAFKKGEKSSDKKLLIDAHMDEVGLIITSVTADGFLKFHPVGGIDTSVLMFRQVKIGEINGVISGKPIHLLSPDERKKLPDKGSLYIDIGASSKEEALSLVKPGEYGVIIGETAENGSKIRAKAIDDRFGCALLIKLLQTKSEWDFYASFTVQEEVGLRGARTAAYTLSPDFALVLEATTAADIAGVGPENKVCVLGEGPAISFMDNATVYDREMYNTALNSGVKCQPKSAVAGGNNSGAVHLSKGGVRTLAISVPCRYIHSPSCVADISDMKNAAELCRYMINAVCGGEL